MARIVTATGLVLANSEAAAGPAGAATGGATSGSLSVLYGVGARLREYISGSLSKRKPWTEMLDRHSFAKPANLSEASARLRKNAAYFRTNYIIVLTTSILLSFLMHPSSLLVLGLLSAAWVYLLALRTGPVVINGRELSEREKIMGMSGISFVVIFFLTNVASVVFSALMMGAALVAVHGATRVPDDLFLDDADVNQGLLSIITGAGAPKASAGISNV